MTFLYLSRILPPEEEFPHLFHHDDGRSDGDDYRPFGRLKGYGFEEALHKGVVYGEELERDDKQGRPNEEHIRERIHPED